MWLFDQNGNLDADVKDALYELGNVGVGMASVTIGKILGMRVILKAPIVMPVESNKIKEFAMGAVSEAKAGFFMEFRNTLEGMVLFILNREFVLRVMEEMAGHTFGPDETLDDDVKLSAAEEFANMISAAYMKAIGTYTGIRLYLSPVMVDVGDGENLLQNALEKLSCACRVAICIRTDFVLIGEDGTESGFTGQVVMLPSQGSLEKLLEALGM